MSAESRVEQILAMVALALLAFGCFFVLRPFLSAIFWAVVLCFSTWPVYTWILRNIGSATVAAVAMTLLVGGHLRAARSSSSARGWRRTSHARPRR